MLHSRGPTRTLTQCSPSHVLFCNGILLCTPRLAWNSWLLCSSLLRSSHIHTLTDFCGFRVTHFSGVLIGCRSIKSSCKDVMHFTSQVWLVFRQIQLGLACSYSTPQGEGNQSPGQDLCLLPMELWAHGPLAASAEFLVFIQQSDSTLSSVHPIVFIPRMVLRLWVGSGLLWPVRRQEPQKQLSHKLQTQPFPAASPLSSALGLPSEQKNKPVWKKMNT